MRSVKPGRGPSAMGALGSVVGVVFGVFWTAMAVSMGAPVIFPVFGVLFILIGVVQTVYNLKNAVGDRRFSVYDITEDGEEPDPLERRMCGAAPPSSGDGPDPGACRFCPYCGTALEEDFSFCPACGRQLPGR